MQIFLSSFSDALRGYAHKTDGKTENAAEISVAFHNIPQKISSVLTVPAVLILSILIFLVLCPVILSVGRAVLIVLPG